MLPKRQLFQNNVPCTLYLAPERQRGKLPSGPYFFASLDADALSRVLGRYALGEGGAGHVAIDGKTLRGSRRDERGVLHVLSAFAVDGVIGDLTVEPDTNEITAALELLKGLPRRHCHRRRDFRATRAEPAYPGGWRR